jgi:hypothetical protein
MANSYRVKIEGSTLGPVGTVVTEADILAAPANVEQLIASGIVEEATSTKKDKE